MIERTISGIVLGAVVLGLLWVGGFVPIVLNIAIYLVIALCMYEIYTALKHQGIIISPYVCIFYIVLLPVAIQVAALKGILALFMITGMLALALQVFHADLTIINTAFTFFMLFYPCMMLSMIPLMLTFPGGGRMAIFFTVLLACTTDAFALYAGMLFGKHKLSPTISPKKTVEGAIGGIIGGGIVGFAMGLIIHVRYYFHVPVWQMVLLGLLGSVAGEIGDLAASIVKRSTGIKDFGKIFPGHGGMMDRMDSILFVAPIVYCYFSIVVFATRM